MDEVDLEISKFVELFSFCPEKGREYTLSSLVENHGLSEGIRALSLCVNRFRERNNLETAARSYLYSYHVKNDTLLCFSFLDRPDKSISSFIGKTILPDLYSEIGIVYKIKDYIGYTQFNSEFEVPICEGTKEKMKVFLPTKVLAFRVEAIPSELKSITDLLVTKKIQVGTFLFLKELAAKNNYFNFELSKDTLVVDDLTSSILPKLISSSETLKEETNLEDPLTEQIRSFFGKLRF